MAEGQPKPAFYVAVLVVVLGLVGLALWRYGAIGPGSKVGQFTADELNKMKGGAEAPDTSGITTVKEYKYVAATKLPEVKGISSYKPMVDRTVRFAINVWAGWSPIIYANNGFKAGKVWKTPGGQDFKVELVLIDDPIAMRDAYAAGNLHVGWATLDMLPLFLEGLRKDSRVMPRVYQQVDWSNGGDGIVVRDNIKTMADLRGKTIVLAQNSPSHFFVLNALIKNRAPVAQEYPSLELTLTDEGKRPVLRRVLMPRDYTDAGRSLEQGITPGGEVPLRVYLDAGRVRATGYRLYLFYP